MDSAPANPSHGLKEPQRLPFESAKIRRLVLGSYWTIIILALPFWWRLTSIERIALPSVRVRAQLERKIVFPVHVQLDAPSFENSAPRLATELNEGLAQTLHASPTWRNLDIRVGIGESAEDRSSPAPNAYTVFLRDRTAVQHPRQLAVSPEDASVHQLARILSGLLAPEISPIQEQRVIQYSDRYRLAFTLLNENAASDRLVHSWDIQPAISADHMFPILSQLNALHNITVESQVQYHAPLAFEPMHFTDGNTSFHGITPEDLTVFINSAEWSLCNYPVSWAFGIRVLTCDSASSVSNDPVLHFVLFVPSSSRQFCILDAHGSRTNQSAFLLPQWGGIFILNRHADGAMVTHLTAADLVPVFAAFSSQLAALLGVPSLPGGVRSEVASPLSDWQLDALLRHRTLENILNSQQTLQSIVKLVDQIEAMPVDQKVRGDVHNALSALEEAYQSAVESPAVPLRWSSEALSLASHAFFNPGMLAMLYFPAEHKYAVYTPLFASISVPLIVALGREIYAWRMERRAARNG
ncbi:phosphatidylinositol-glycan biosynthesis class S protein-domain-containing protein [Butyriboletus roseoflavus]|nr:phosphatidylinositol-glycan biosynthesis class S protein-domain-containing protein [Butyriboletus roseoflavus]